MNEGGADTELSDKPFEDRLAYFKEQEVIDVTNGLGWLIKDADELFDLNVHMNEVQSQGRFPVLGFKDGTALMIGGANDRFEHRQILKASGKSEADILFASGMEGMIRTAAIPYLELTASRDGEYFRDGDKTRIMIRTDTDIRVPDGVTTVARPGGHEFLEKVYGGVKGVTINTPASWKEIKS